MRRKTISLLLTAALAFTLAACGSTSQSTSNPPADQVMEESKVTGESANAQNAVSQDASKAEAADSVAKDASKAESADSSVAKAESTDSAIKPELMDGSKQTESKTESKTESETESKTESKAESKAESETESGDKQAEAGTSKGQLGDYDPDDVKVSFNLGHEDGKEFAYITAVYNGKEIWNKTTGSYPIAQLNCVSDLGKNGRTYYYVERGSIVCLDLETGSELWRNSDFGGSPAQWAYGYGGDGKLYISGYLGPDLFICDKNGATVKLIGQFKEDYYWPYELTYYDDADIVKLVYEMYPEGASDTLLISMKDYSAKTEDDYDDEADKGEIYYANVKEYLSLRSKASTEASVIEKLPRGTAMELIGYENDMAKVEVVDSGKVGYVNPDYISKTKPSGSSSNSSSGSSSSDSSSSSSKNSYGLEAGMTVYANVKEYLSLREEASTSSDVITQLPDWTKMTVLDPPQGKMVHVRVDESGLTGYVHVDFLSY